MKTKTIGLALLLSIAAGAMCFANPTMGTWKLNESKSKFGEGTGGHGGCGRKRAIKTNARSTEPT